MMDVDLPTRAHPASGRTWLRFVILASDGATKSVGDVLSVKLSGTIKNAGKLSRGVDRHHAFFPKGLLAASLRA
jgi:hypothetical protein